MGETLIRIQGLGRVADTSLQAETVETVSGSVHCRWYQTSAGREGRVVAPPDAQEGAERAQLPLQPPPASTSRERFMLMPRIPSSLALLALTREVVH